AAAVGEVRGGDLGSRPERREAVARDLRDAGGCGGWLYDEAAYKLRVSRAGLNFPHLVGSSGGWKPVRVTKRRRQPPEIHSLAGFIVKSSRVAKIHGFDELDIEKRINDLNLLMDPDDFLRLKNK
ncbi:ethylene-responsive transcription factor 13, partial [Phtheirospermum japonicum]